LQKAEIRILIPRKCTTIQWVLWSWSEPRIFGKVLRSKFFLLNHGGLNFFSPIRAQQFSVQSAHFHQTTPSFRLFLLALSRSDHPSLNTEY